MTDANAIDAPTQNDNVTETIVEPLEVGRLVDLATQQAFSEVGRFKDEKDLSLHPSYTNFKLPYNIICRERYVAKKHAFEEQFHKELTTMLSFQPTAYDAARYNRHLCITTLWPPLHNRQEIEYFQKDFFPLTRKQKTRLDFMLNNKIQ